MKDISIQTAQSRLDAMSGQDMVAQAFDLFAGRIALVSSFGTESAVLLHMAAEIAKDFPVIFLDTGKLFASTHDYHAHLIARLGLTGVRTIRPEPADVRKEDRTGGLWRRDPDQCCTVRKVWPLARALEGYEAWISGRKRFQNTDRMQAESAQIQDGKLVLSPLLNWSKPDLNDYFDKHDLPRHPLEREGYSSVGCMTCTMPVRNGEDQRAGRWQGQEKTECGIHLPRLNSAA